MGNIFFFIGTEAELIKVFPVMLELKKAGRDYFVVASGQNDICKSRVLKSVNGGKVDLELSDEKNIRKSAMGLMGWYIKTAAKAKQRFVGKFGLPNHNDIMIVHGDTISTVMGAYLGHRLGMKVAHIEAGLRSHNYLNPFPEEIDRMLVSRIADYHFAPGQYAVDNLKNAKGIVINTKVNTLIDALSYSERIKECEGVSSFINKYNNYFVCVIHRQENVSNTSFFIDMLKIVKELSKRLHCLFILHEITKKKLIRENQLDSLKDDDNFTLISRVQYFDFMKILSSAEYVITDGGSNQEELYYMGKPAFILRRNTERREGIGQNAVLLNNGDVSKVLEFAKNYKMYENVYKIDCDSPSRIIVNRLLDDYEQ